MNLHQGGGEGMYYYLEFIRKIKLVCEDPDNYLTEWKVVEYGDNVNIERETPVNCYTDELDCDCKIYGEMEHGLCICGQHIIRYVIIQNKYNNNVVQIGKDCGKKYMGLKLKPTCKECSKSIKSKKEVYCKYCREKLIIKFGKYKGRKFEDILLEDKPYCMWVLKQQTTSRYMLVLQNWLVKNIFGQTS